MGIVDFFKESYKKIFNTDYQNFLNCLENLKVEKRSILDSNNYFFQEKCKVKNKQKQAFELRQQGLDLLRRKIPEETFEDVFKRIEIKFFLATKQEKEAQEIVEKLHKQLFTISDPMERKILCNLS